MVYRLGELVGLEPRVLQSHLSHQHQIPEFLIRFGVGSASFKQSIFHLILFVLDYELVIWICGQVQERFEVDIKELPEQIDTSTYSKRRELLSLVLFCCVFCTLTLLFLLLCCLQCRLKISTSLWWGNRAVEICNYPFPFVLFCFEKICRPFVKLLKRRGI